jgi:hypothetical protein
MPWTSSDVTAPGEAVSKEPEGADKQAPNGGQPEGQKRKKIVVVGLGMVGIAFM